MARDDDGYGRHWEYRVFSSMWMEPDVPESGRRHLTVHGVDYQVGALSDHPLPDDVIYIEAKPASPNGVEMEAALLDAERIMHAFNKPALIKA
jgi:hypothetical protein